MIGRSKMHHIDIGITQQIVQRAIDARMPSSAAFCWAFSFVASASPNTWMPERRKPSTWAAPIKPVLPPDADGLPGELFGHAGISLTCFWSCFVLEITPVVL